MAKPNNKNKRNNNNYFTQQIQKGGENFLASKTPRNLANDSDRIFRDLVRGNVDIQQYKEYLLNPSFLEVMVTKAGERYNYWWAVKVAIDSYICNLNTQKQNNIPVDENTMIIFGGVFNDVFAKFTVYQQLYNCLLIVKETGFVDSLDNLSRVVGNYRFSI